MYAVKYYSESIGEMSHYFGEVTARYEKAFIAGYRRYSTYGVAFFDTESEALEFFAEL
jgi:hypothetical protein